VLLGITGYYLTGNKPSEVIFSEVKSTDLPVNEYILPDGSKVSLNKGSKIVFPETFEKEIREITLEGEGFFEITHNPNQPFVINAGKSQIKVLGTSFNVNAYSDNSTVEVVVKTGKVMLNGSGIETAENNSVYLTAGEKGTFFKKKNSVEKSTNENVNFLSWKTHNLEFDKMPLPEVISSIENLYSVDIQLDESLTDLKLTAYFENKPVDFVLNVIKITFNLELTNNETVYNFKPKK
jgi:ferric-dicitrate binding protein FerR (iron transport regulator)